MKCHTYRTRAADEHGETLVVRSVQGQKVLIDPCDEFAVVYVSTGRRARLVRFNYDGLAACRRRDVLTVVVNSAAGTGFASVGRPRFSVMLSNLPEGQIVDVLPAAEPAVAYAAILRPVPHLVGAVAVNPVYAAVAA